MPLQATVALLQKLLRTSVSTLARHGLIQNLKPAGGCIVDLQVFANCAIVAAVPFHRHFGAMALGIGVSSAPTHAQSQQDTTLPAVNVEANADKPDGYLATTTRVGKFLQSPQDIPQAVTVITSTLLEEQQVKVQN